VSKRPASHHLRYREPAHEGEAIEYLCKRVIYRGRSRFQAIDIIETQLHGRMLFLDGIAQSSEMDEFIYHEMLVHPALLSVSRPEAVLVIGGAEGATVREVLRHQSVRRVVMVDIDGRLIEVCQEHLPGWHAGAFEDPRLEVVVEDGRRYLESVTESFDAILVDLSDPLEGSPAVYLFTREFYRCVRERLNPGGAAAFQGEGVSPQQVELHARMVNTLKSVFPVVQPYPYFIHSFHRPDAHILVPLDPAWSQAKFVESVRNCGLPLRYLSPETARAMFCLPPYLRKAYERYSRIITDDDPSLEGKAGG